VEASQWRGLQRPIVANILENVAKATAARPRLTLSHGAAVAQAEAHRRQHPQAKHTGAASEASTGTESSAKDVVVFTCGHHFPRDGFLDHVLATFQGEVQAIAPKLKGLAKALVQHYQQVRKGVEEGAKRKACCSPNELASASLPCLCAAADHLPRLPQVRPHGSPSCRAIADVKGAQQGLPAWPPFMLC
jgi:hypothetical protein